MIEQLRSLFEIIKTLIENKFYGSFTIKFEAGKIVKFRQAPGSSERKEHNDRRNKRIDD